MITIQLLEDDDIIQAGDLYRPLSLFYGGQSDYIATENTYSGGPINNMGWVAVERVGMSDHWAGKTVGEFNEQMEKFGEWEFVRGPIPASHHEPLTSGERRARDSRKILTFGKHKGQTQSYVASVDTKYYHWAVDQGIMDPILRSNY